MVSVPTSFLTVPEMDGFNDSAFPRARERCELTQKMLVEQFRNRIPKGTLFFTGTTREYDIKHATTYATILKISKDDLEVDANVFEALMDNLHSFTRLGELARPCYGERLPFKCWLTVLVAKRDIDLDADLLGYDLGLDVGRPYCPHGRTYNRQWIEYVFSSLSAVSCLEVVKTYPTVFTRNAPSILGSLMVNPAKYNISLGIEPGNRDDRYKIPSLLPERMGPWSRVACITNEFLQIFNRWILDNEAMTPELRGAMVRHIAIPISYRHTFYIHSDGRSLCGIGYLVYEHGRRQCHVEPDFAVEGIPDKEAIDAGLAACFEAVQDDPRLLDVDVSDSSQSLPLLNAVLRKIDASRKAKLEEARRKVEDLNAAFQLECAQKVKAEKRKRQEAWEEEKVAAKMPRKQ
jgi:hypothetical protein